MGSAIAERIKPGYQVFVFDKDKEKTKNLKSIQVAENLISLVEYSDVVMLAVKPQDFEAVLNEIKDYVKDKLIISIAAGLTTSYLERVLCEARIVRVMPNIGVKIGEAESSLCKGKNTKQRDINFATKLFNRIGKTWVIKEEMIDAATAISGSGPAYIFYDMEVNKIDPNNISEEKKQDYIARLAKASEKLGFDSQTARDLAVNISTTSINLVKETGESPSELRRLVTSKGGTTESALKILIDGGSWEEAAEAAKKRAKELSRG